MNVWKDFREDQKKMLSKGFKKDLPIILLLGILVILFFYKVIFFNNIFCYRDMLTCVIPEKFFARSMFLAGNLPLWNPYILCGYSPKR